MAAKKSRRKLKGCFVISPIADDSTPERAEIRRRALYLEKLIAKAMEILGFDAKLIINDPSKELITPHMIKRLGSDEIAVAVLDGANPNVLYELSVRHAYCLPVVSLIEKKGDGAGPELPFDIRDVAPMEYPQLSEGETWSRKIENQFVGDLVERARSALNIYEPAEHFRKSLNVIANSKKMGMVFGQKTVQLRQASKELEDVRRLLRKDYDINDTIPPDAAGRFFDMVNRTWHSMFIGNDLLGSMLEGVGSVQLRLQSVRRRCNAICVKVNELAGKLSELARDLERQVRAENADEDSGEVTRDRIESQISELMNEIDGLNKKIQAIEGLLR